MSHVRRLSPALAAALLGTSAAIPLPVIEQPVNASTASPDTGIRGVPVHRFAADVDAFAAEIERGLTAARKLIADPRPYRIDVDALNRMVSAVEVIAKAPASMNVSLPADTYAMLAECVRADRARAFKRQEAWAVAEVVAERAGKVMFAFSEARRQDPGGLRIDPPGHVAFVGPDATAGEA